MLLGQGGNDVLDGGDGDDDVGGDGGDDRLTGGRGSDIFSFDLMATGSPGVDTITDFARGEDLIWIMGSGAQWLALDSDGSGTLDDGDLAVSVDGEGLRRVAMTPRLVNSARLICVLLPERDGDAGARVAIESREAPARLLRPVGGELRWYAHESLCRALASEGNAGADGVERG